jgi:hypothetical protein
MTEIKNHPSPQSQPMQQPPTPASLAPTTNDKGALLKTVTQLSATNSMAHTAHEFQRQQTTENRRAKFKDESLTNPAKAWFFGFIQQNSPFNHPLHMPGKFFDIE